MDTSADAIRVLLVGADQRGYLLMQRLLQQATGSGFELRWASADHSESDPPAVSDFDVCLVDDGVGDDKCLDIVRRFSSAPNAVPAIVLASRLKPRLEVDAVAAGAADLLIKSRLSARPLEHALRYAVGRSRREPAPKASAASAPNYRLSYLSNLAVGVIVTDPTQDDNPIVYVNRAFTEMTGYSEEDALGHNPRFMNHSGSDPAVEQEIRDSLQRGAQFTGVMSKRRKDGSTFQCALVISPVLGDQGELVNCIMLAEDVTAQRDAQIAVSQQQDRLLSLLDQAPGVLFRAQSRDDGSIRLLYAGEGFRELVGVDPEEFQLDSEAVERLFNPRSGVGSRPLKNSLSAGTRPLRWDVRIALPTGEDRVLHVLVRPQGELNGKTIWNGLLIDVTERANAEQRASELASIVEHSESAIIGKDLNGIVTSWNKAAELMYGYRADEIIGRHISVLLPADRPHEIDDLLGHIASGAHVHSFETARRTKDGRLINVSLTISPIRDSDGKIVGASGFIQDITLRKRWEAKLAESSVKSARIAETLQRSMLLAPPQGTFSGLNIQTHYEAALNEAEVGGDFFDAFLLSAGKVAVLVGDVSGKGLAAAGRTAEVKYALRAFLHGHPAPHIALSHLNDFVFETHKQDWPVEQTFVVLSLAVVNTVTGETWLISAGAEPVLILRSNGLVQRVASSGCPIGIHSPVSYDLRNEQLGVGDTLIMVTDGITEARRDSEFLGLDGLERIVNAIGQTPTVTELSRRILIGVREYATAGFRDDVCMLLARREPNAHERVTHSANQPI